jgi:hypothetical protein
MFQVADAGQDQAADQQLTQTNESIVQEYDAYQFVDVALDEYTTGFNSTVTVYNSTNATLTEGTDYEWNETDGTILFKSTANTTEGNTAYITYDYTENTPGVQTLSGPVGVIVEAVGTFGLLGGGFAFVVFLLAIAVFFGKKFTSSAVKTNR